MAVESEMCGVVFMAGKLGVISGAVAGGGMETRSGVHPGAGGLVRQAEVSGQAGRGRESAGGLQKVFLTRSREAAKGDAVGLLWCVLNSLLSSQLSRICSLWHVCHGPLTPDPSPPFHGGEGRKCVQFGEPWTGVRGWLCSVARAFQPEICALRLECLEMAARSGAFAGCWAHPKVRSGEGESHAAGGQRGAASFGAGDVFLLRMVCGGRIRVLWCRSVDPVTGVF